VYGVVLHEGTFDVEDRATDDRREILRRDRRRIAEAEGTPGVADPSAAPWDPSADGRRLSGTVFVDLRGGEPVHRCRCGHSLGPADGTYKRYAARARRPVQDLGPEVNPYHVNGARFELREFFCPGCWTRLEVEIARPGDPILEDARVSAP